MMLTWLKHYLAVSPLPIRGLTALIIVIPALSLGGCSGELGGPSDPSDICAELGTTMVGFSGPNERLKIFKNYGYDTDDYQTYEWLIQTARKTSNAFPSDSNARACLERVVVCENMIRALEKGPPAPDQEVEKIMSRMKSCPKYS